MKNDFEELKTARIDAYWSKREAQYRSIEAAYNQKAAAATISSEIDKETMKRKGSFVESSKKKVLKEEENQGDEEEEEEIEEEKEKSEERDEEEIEEAKHGRKYVLDFMEINAADMGQLKIHNTQRRLTLKERLNLSYIEIVEEEGIQKQALSKSSLLLIENWRKATTNQDEIFVPSPPPTNLTEMSISNISTSLFLYDKELTRKNCKYNYTRTEIDYIVKFASVLLQNTFSTSKDVTIDWDTLSFSSKEKMPNLFKANRPDIIVFCSSGIEVGCGEIKPPQKSKELIDIDRARIAELCKRQLHMRLKTAKNKKQLRTFGILMTELTMMKLDNKKYKQCILEKTNLPKRGNNYEGLENCLESLFGLKNMIEESLSADSDKDKIDFDEFADFIKPTARFLK
ncbi:hypothetical protein EDC96DRAFT_580333 [Choanephora cucurbitarum]|nr:hypothetical protein EDC96DRAFT_580333 [Choanephora cucurbitarum]